MRRLIILVLCLIAVPKTASAADKIADVNGVVSMKLENGLRVLLRPVRGATQVAVVVLYSIGGDHDPEGRSGLAHLVEHVYVTAAAGDQPARTAEEYSRRYPAGWNAQTGDQYTVVATVFPGKDLNSELGDAAQRMGQLRIVPADLDREQPRVTVELENMFGRIPQLGARNHARELVRPTPLAGRKGGLPEHLARLTAADIQERWRRYYKPKNALLVVAGAIDAADARELIKKHFDQLPGGEAVPQPNLPGEGRPGQARTIAVKPIVVGSSSEACLAYRAPEPANVLFAPFLVLAARLQTNSAKFEAGANRFPVSFTPMDDGAVISIGISARPDETSESATKKMQSIAAAIVNQPLTPQETALVGQTYGPMLGLTDLADQMIAANPYFVAFTLARRQQMGLDPVKLKAALASLTDDDLRLAASQIFGPERGAGVLVSIATD